MKIESSKPMGDKWWNHRLLVGKPDPLLLEIETDISTFEDRLFGDRRSIPWSCLTSNWPCIEFCYEVGGQKGNTNVLRACGVRDSRKAIYFREINASANDDTVVQSIMELISQGVLSLGTICWPRRTFSQWRRSSDSTSSHCLERESMYFFIAVVG